MKFLTTLKNIPKWYNNIPVAAKVSFWFIICNVVQRGISVFTTPFFTRFMTTEQFGQVTLYNSWVNIICIFSTLNLQYGSFNTAQIKFSDDRKAYTSSIQGLVLVITGIMLILFSVIGETLSILTELPLLIMLLMLIQINSRFNSEIWMANCRFDYKYKAMTIITLASCFAGQILSVIFVFISFEKGYMRILAIAIVEILFGISIAIYNYKQGKKFFSKKYWKYALKFNIPLIPYYLSQVVFNTSDRIMISYMVGIDKAGIYGLAYTISLLLKFVISAIRSSYTPWFFKRVQEKNSPTVKKINITVMFAIFVALGILLFIAPEVLLLMGGTKYYEAIWIIPPVIAGILFEFFTDLPCNILFFYEKKSSLVLSTVICALINIILNYFGIVLFGYYATAYATLICYILFWVFLYISARNICRKNEIDIDSYLIPKTQCSLGVLFLVLSLVAILLYPIWYVRYGILMVVAIVAIINYKRILSVARKILEMRK